MPPHRPFFAFPDPVNEYAARTVAGGVVGLAVAALALDQPWMLVPLAYGFWARLLTGPTMSPLGQLATRVVAPRLPWGNRPTPGPPKRFAQGIGAVFATAALAFWLAGRWGVSEWLLGTLAVAAAAESVLGLCVGCKAFALLMRLGVIPDSVCEACGDLSRRYPELTTGPRAHAGTTG